MRAAIDPLGPGARWQDADHTHAGSGPAAVRRRGLGNADKIPTGPPPRLSLLHGAPRLTAIERDCRYPHPHFVAVRVAQINLFDRELLRGGRIDDNSTD